LSLGTLIEIRPPQFELKNDPMFNDASAVELTFTPKLMMRLALPASHVESAHSGVDHVVTIIQRPVLRTSGYVLRITS